MAYIDWDKNIKRIRLIKLSVFSALVISLSVALLTVLALFSFMKSNERASHTLEVINVVEDTVSLSKDVLIGNRGYIITADERYLLPFLEGKKKLSNLTVKLRMLVSDNQAQLNRAQKIEIRSHDLIAFANVLISSVKEGNASKAIVMVVDGKGKILMDEIRRLALEMLREEELLLSVRKKDERIMGIIALAGISGSVISQFVLLFGVLLLFKRYRADLVSSRFQIEEKNNELENLNVELMSMNEEFEAQNEALAISNNELMSAHNEIETVNRELLDLYNNVPCGYHSLSSDGTFIKINKTELAWLGYREEEVVGRLKITDILTEETKPNFISNYPLFKERGYVNDLEFDMIRKDGSIFNVAVNATAVYDADGNYRMSRSSVFDVSDRKRMMEEIKNVNILLESRVSERTKKLKSVINALEREVMERKSAEEAARKNEERFRSTLENMFEGCQIIDREFRYIFVNKAAASHGKSTKKEIEGRTMMEMYPGIENTELFKVIRTCMSGGEPSNLENNFTYPDGTYGWFELSIQPSPEGVFILSSDITSRKIAEEDRIARDAAELANKAKSDFLSNMSHELRTPLNSIIGFNEVLQDEMFGELNGKQREYLGYIEKSSRHLLSLINDILDISKIEAGKMEIEIGPVGIRPLVEGALVMVREKALKQSITLSSSIPPDADGTIQADERKLKQVLYNLLSNAVKFTPSGGSISLMAKRAGEMLEISVTDTGIGIPKEQMPRLFTRFGQLEGTYEKKYDGTGLGLALVKDLVELHGGRVWAESEPGIGSTFHIAVPYISFIEVKNSE